jgi:competence protein ComEC
MRPRRQTDLTESLAFRTSPAFFAACFFALGILLSDLLFEPPPLALLIFLLSGAAAHLATHKAIRISLAPVCLTCIAAGLFCAGIHPSPDPQTALLNYSSRAANTFQGAVIRAGPVRIIQSTAPFASHAVKEKSQTLDLRLHSIADAAGAQEQITGGIRLTLYTSADAAFPSFVCGEMLQVTAPLHPPERFNDPGVWNSTAYLLEQGIGALASAKAFAAVVAPNPAKASLACRVKTIQQAASERIMQLADPNSGIAPLVHLPEFFRLSTEDASMLAAIITGDRAWLQRRTRIGFERTGSFHLLVVSGLHLAIFAGIIFWLAQRIRLPRLWATLLTIAAALAYAVFTGFGQPVQRSFWMVTLYLLGRLLWRDKSALNATGFAALCLLAVNPLTLFDAGFQMTMLSVLAIAGIATPVAERSFAPYLRATQRLSLIAIDSSLPPRIAQFRVSLRLLATHLTPLTGKRFANSAPAASIRFVLRVTELLLVSIVVEVVMSLPMAIYFHRITVLALPVNFLIIPFVGLLLPCALLTFATLLISAKLAAIPAAITAALLHWVVALIHVFANLKAGDLRMPGSSTASIAVFVALLGLAIYAARLRRFAISACASILMSMAIVVVAPRSIQHKAGVLEVTAIDVGQGDSLLLITPEGKTLLIDAGGSPFGPPPGLASFDIGEEVVSAYLWSRGIRRLDAVALTHADHIGGMPAVLANFRPREVWIGNNPHSTAYDAFLAEAVSAGAVIERHTAGEHFPFGSTDIEVLAPESSYRPGPIPTNNDSLVLRIQFGATSALLEGDAEAPSEERMLADNSSALHSDLLKVGHHGSRTSTTPKFLAAVIPSFAVISVGRRNFYGHPRIEVLNELQADHIRTYRTDALGVSTFYLNGKKVAPASLPATN